MNRSFHSKSSRVASCSPEEVTKLIVDATKWSDWQPEIHTVVGPSSMDPGDVAEGHARMLGFHVNGHATARGVGPDFFEQDVIVGVKMRIRYEVVPVEGGSLITHNLVAQMPGGVAGRVLTLFLRRRLRWMQRTALDNLTRQSEAATSS